MRSLRAMLVFTASRIPIMRRSCFVLHFSATNSSFGTIRLIRAAYGVLRAEIEESLYGGQERPQLCFIAMDELIESCEGTGPRLCE